MEAENKVNTAYVTKKPNKALLTISIIGFVFSLLWILLSPVVSFSKGFASPRLITIRDKNLGTDITVTVEESDLQYSKELQTRFCNVDMDDLDEKLRVMKELFAENGLSFHTHHGDVQFFDHNNSTSLGRLPTLVYGVWHPTKTTGSPTSIVLSTELNLNSTANPKAGLHRGECNYAIPSNLAILLTTLHSIQKSERMNHDVVIAVYLRKYDELMNHIVNRKDINMLLSEISRPLFSLHLDNPENIIPLTESFIGYSLDAAGMNGKNANLDLVGVVLKNLPIRDYQSSHSTYLSFLQSFLEASFSRYRGIQQFFISQSIPAVSLRMHSRPATLQERTQASRTEQLHSLLHGLKAVVESAGSAESRIDRNAITFIPLFGRIPRIVVREDILFPTLMMLSSFACLVISVDMLHLPTKTGWIYSGLLAIVAGCYMKILAIMSPVLEENRFNTGFSLFINFFLLYSFWAYCRVVFNNFLIQWQITTELEYKTSGLSMACLTTMVFSYLYIMRNPFLVAMVLSVVYLLLVITIVTSASTTRFGMLYVYSFLLAAPFVLMIFDGFVQWNGDLIAMMSEDGWLFCYLMVVAIADHAILHYANGLHFIGEDEEEEKKPEEKLKKD